MRTVAEELIAHDIYNIFFEYSVGASRGVPLAPEGENAICPYRGNYLFQETINIALRKKCALNKTG
jgi:hypothetical protein